MPRVSARFGALPAYPLGDVPALKRQLRADGVDLIDLGVGDADLPPPPAAVAALTTAAADPANSRYSFQLGLVAFREEIADWMVRRFGVQVDPFEELVPVVGSKEGLFHLPLAYLDPGDIAIIPDPGYQVYLGGALFSGGEPYLVALRPENDFLIPLDDLPRDVVARAKLLYLNYPNNPTTATAPREHLQKAVDFCHRHDILIAYDNAYSEVAYGGFRPPSILEIEGARDVAVEFHSLSKTYNMTGWRVGWAVGAASAIAALTRVKTFSDTGVPFTVQHAALAALRTQGSWLPQNLAVFEARRDAAVDAFRRVGVGLSPPSATMYLWVPLPEGTASEPFARRLLLEQGVAVLPGAALGRGGEGFYRIALTVPEERLAEAIERIGRAL
ncbi:MAG: aminotransferase class I/II-fold pyridoxal phosphate-dependent enzyme [Gemmatimonas sp.]|nr:aminotransferase class I/II-fold pyridoxal phosphate-dependent enzyme [Gemmatimonas sp.]